MHKVTLSTLQKLKQQGKKITVLTCYDSTFAGIARAAGVEALLVGDTLGMVLQGHDSTLPVTIENIQYHTACVVNANSGAFIIADMPFMSYSNAEHALRNAGKLMQAGANMVKLEGDMWLHDTIRQLANNGIPVCAHLGLTPQSVNILGGFKVQGRDPVQAEKILHTAIALELAGASMLLLECVPSSLGKKVSEALHIPVIGIGAGVDTDAQVLVLHDMLGLSGKTPKFVRNFLVEGSNIQAAISAYVMAVKDKSFPAIEHGY